MSEKDGSFGKQYAWGEGGGGGGGIAKGDVTNLLSDSVHLPSMFLYN